MPKPGTIGDLVGYMLNDYWNKAGETPPWQDILNQFKLVPYSTQGLDTQAEKDMATAAMALWQDVSDIQFGEVVDPPPLWATIVFEDDEVGDNPVAETDTSGLGAVVNISSCWINENGTGLGTKSFTAYVHEIGHALGLGHPGWYNADPDNPGSINYDDDALFANDTWQASIMSYFSQPNEDGAGNDYALPMTPQMADIAALQSKYGAATTRTGDTTYGFNSNAGRPVFDFSNYITADMGEPWLPVALTIYDSGGTDTLDCSGFSQNQTISLWAGTYSDIGGLNGNVGIWGMGVASDTVIENAIGGSGWDTIYGNAANNELVGGGGSDYLVGYSGLDHLYGEAGKDTLDGGDDSDDLYGGDNNDVLHGGKADDVLVGNDGDDYLDGGPGGDLILGGAGVDTASYAGAQAGVTVNLDAPAANTGDAAGDTYASVEYIQGSDYDDILIGNDDSNILWGGKYADELHGGDGNDYDQLFGEEGSDKLFASKGLDYLDGGDGFDTVVYYGNTVIVDLVDSSLNDGEAKGDALLWIEKVIADGGNDQLFGDDKSNWLHGSRGNDLLNGRGGSDILDGGADNDTVTYSDAPKGVTADLTQQSGGPTGEEEHDTFFSVENLIGSQHEDVLIGDGKANILDGGDRKDILKGGGGSDTLLGGDDDDTLDGGVGADALDGGDGVDTASYTASAAAVTVNLAAKTATGGDAAGDTLVSIENLIGSSDNDKLTGDGGNNTLNGLSGRDVLTGGGGKDTLDGGAGDDILFGDAGSDTFMFGVGFGNDVIEGFNEKHDQDFIGFDHNVFADFKAVQNAMSQVGSSVFITVDAQNNIELTGTNLKWLGADDFIFV